MIHGATELLSLETVRKHGRMERTQLSMAPEFVKPKLRAWQKEESIQTEDHSTKGKAPDPSGIHELLQTRDGRMSRGESPPLSDVRSGAHVQPLTP